MSSPSSWSAKRIWPSSTASSLDSHRWRTSCSRVERVAGGLLVQLRQHVLAGLLVAPRDRADQAGHLGVVEAGQRDPPAPAPIEVGERRSELVGRRRLPCRGSRRRRAPARRPGLGRGVGAGAARWARPSARRRGSGSASRSTRPGGAGRRPPRTAGDAPWRRRWRRGGGAHSRSARRGAMRWSSPPQRSQCSRSRASGACSTRVATMLRKGSSGTAAPSEQRP